MNWTAISALSAAAQSIVVIVTLAFAIVSVRESKATARSEALFRIMDEYHSDALRSDRRAVEARPHQRFGSMAAELQASYDRLTESFNRLGYVVRRNMVSQSEVLALYDASLVANWHRLRLYVSTKRTELGYTNYGRDFESLACRATEFVVKNFGPEALARIIAADDGSRT